MSNTNNQNGSFEPFWQEDMQMSGITLGGNAIMGVGVVCDCGIPGCMVHCCVQTSLHGYTNQVCSMTAVGKCLIHGDGNAQPQPFPNFREDFDANANWQNPFGQTISQASQPLALNGNGGFDGAFDQPSQPPLLQNTQRSSSTQRVPIPPLQRTQSSATTAAASGPMSRPVEVPARPKPGRKPLPAEESNDRRREQNRMAQRNFRDKRQQKLSEAQQAIEANRQEYQENIANMTVQHAEEKRRLEIQHSEERRRLENRIKELQQSNQRLEEEISSLRTSLPTPDSMEPSPRGRSRGAYRRTGPNISPMALTRVTPADEVDFTNLGRRSSGQMRPSSPNDGGRSSYTMGPRPDLCGFCTDDANCACRLVPSIELPAPGNCNACVQDPARRAACQGIAARSQGRSRNAQGPMLGCSQFMDRVQATGAPMQGVETAVGSQFRIYPSAQAGFEVEEQEAAEVLQNLAATVRK